jgi:hypothetical protein
MDGCPHGTHVAQGRRRIGGNYPPEDAQQCPLIKTSRASVHSDTLSHRRNIPRKWSWTPTVHVYALPQIQIILTAWTSRDGPEACITKENCRAIAVVFWLLRGSCARKGSENFSPSRRICPLPTWTRPNVTNEYPKSLPPSSLSRSPLSLQTHARAAPPRSAGIGLP